MGTGYWEVVMGTGKMGSSNEGKPNGGKRNWKQ